MIRATRAARGRRRVAAALAGALPLAAAAAEPASPAGGLLQVLLGLLAVLALMAVGAWLLRRFANGRAVASGAVRVVGGTMLGGRERIVVVEIGDRWIVTGVSPGRVNALAVLPRVDLPRPASGAAPADGFPTWLKRRMEQRDGR